MKFNNLSYYKKHEILQSLANKIMIVGACEINDQFLQLRLKDGSNMWKVKSILKNYFDIDYFRKLDYINNINNRFCFEVDILKLCKIFLENNEDLDYYSHFDPLKEKDKISKVVYQYGKVRYDLLAV